MKVILNKYKSYLIVIIIVTISSVGFEFYKVSNKASKYIITSEIFLGSLSFYYPNEQQQTNYTLIQYEVLKNQLYNNYSPNMHISYDLRDIRNSVVKIVYSHNKKQNLELVITDIFQLIQEDAVLYLNSFQNYKIISSKLPYIVKSQITELKYNFNIYFILSSVLLGFISTYIVIQINRFLRGELVKK